MKKVLAIILAVLMTISFTACNNKNGDGLTEGPVGQESVLFSDLDIIYNLENITENEWNGYEYGFEGYMNNKDVFVSRYEKNIGHIDALSRNQVSYTYYTKIDKKYPISISCNTEEFLFPKDILAQFYEEGDVLEFFALDNRLWLNPVDLKIAEEVEGGYDLEKEIYIKNGYLQVNTINGWNVFTSETNPGYAVLTKRIQDNFVMKIEVTMPNESNNEDVSDKNYLDGKNKDNYIEKVAKSFTFETLNDVDNFKIVLPEKVNEIKLSDSISLNMQSDNFILESWRSEGSGSEDNFIRIQNSYGISTIDGLDYEIFSFAVLNGYKNIDDYILKNSETLTFEEAQYNGLSYYIMRTQESKLGDRVVIEEGSFSGIVFEANGALYCANVINLKDTSKEFEDGCIKFIFNELLTIK